MSAYPTPATVHGHSTGGNTAPPVEQPATYKVWYEGDHGQARHAIVTADRIDRGDKYVEMYSGGRLVFVVPAGRLYTIVATPNGTA